MFNEKQVKISDKKGVLYNAYFNGLRNKNKCSLTLVVEEKVIRSTAEKENYFECLLEIRKELEKMDLLILCLGAAKNVYPSRMTLQMSNGAKAYRLQLGKQASMNDLVDIFEPSKDDDVCTIEDQKTYFESWLKSLKN